MNEVVLLIFSRTAYSAQCVATHATRYLSSSVVDSEYTSSERLSTNGVFEASVKRL